MKVEIWNGHNIRFVELNSEWWAVAKDVAEALGYKKPENAVAIHVCDEDKTTTLIQGSGSNYKTTVVIISEFGMYDLVFSSKMPQAKSFKRWVYSTIQQLRKLSGLEGFEIFRMLDKEHQRKTMNQLCQSLSHPVQLDFMKANMIANKAVSTKFGYPKMVKKSEMTPQMLTEREPILEDTVSLMALQDKYHLNLSVSKAIYDGLDQQVTA